MKKALYGLLGLASMGALALSSCGRVEILSINVWTYYNSKTEESFVEMIDEFNHSLGEEKGIVVSSETKGSVDELTSSLKNAATNQAGSQAMPDLFLAYTDMAYEMDSFNKVAALDSYFTSTELENYSKGFLDEGRFDSQNNLKILPVSKSTEALFVNKTDFDKFLSAYSDVNVGYDDLTTMEGIVKVSKAYYEKTGKAFFGRDSLDNYFVVGAKQLGIDIFDYSNSAYRINYNKEVFKRLWDNYYVPYVKGYFSSVGKWRSDDIKTGEVLAYVGSTSSGGYFPGSVVKSETEAYPIESLVLTAPTFEGGAKYAVSQGAGFCVTKSEAKREKAAVTFLKWLSEREQIQKFSNSSGYFPATYNGFTEEFIESQKTKHYQATFRACRETLDTYQMYTNIVGPNSTSYRNGLKNSLEEYSKNARSKVVALGATKEAIEEYTSDSKFEEWFKEITK